MKQAFRFFMGGLIDYAGLFPPARLDLDTALQNYLRFRREPDAWMLGRFICPAAQLEKIFPERQKLIQRERQPLRLSVLAGLVGGEEEISSTLREEAEKIRSFLQGTRKKCAIDVLETRLPMETVEAARPERVTRYLETYLSILQGMDVSVPDLFVEVAGTPDWRETDAAAVAGIARAMKKRGRGARKGDAPMLGVKLRCGGLEPDAFPTTERIAALITACRDARVPVKCTAGLHHPIRHRSEETGAMSHGFFNIFGAGIFAHAKKWPRKEIERCLEEERPERFSFEEDRFAWREEAIPLSALKKARGEFMTGFGSCSFDEPREHLRILGWLY